MRYFYDWEFLEDGSTIDPISIGIVSDDGREYYAVNSDANWAKVRAHSFLRENVLPSLPTPARYLKDLRSLNEHGRNEWYRKFWELDKTSTLVKPLWVIRNEVLAFLRGVHEGDPIELWSWYAAYDHVALAQLWGPMSQMPEELPRFTHDIEQYACSKGVSTDELARVESSVAHNALDDAIYHMSMFNFVRDFAANAEADRDMAKWQEGYGAAVASRTTDKAEHDAVLATRRDNREEAEASARAMIGELQCIVGILVSSMGGSVSVTRKDLELIGQHILHISDDYFPEETITIRVTPKEGGSGKRQGRTKRIRLPESVADVPGAPAEGGEQVQGSTNFERRENALPAEPNGPEGSPQATLSDLAAEEDGSIVGLLSSTEYQEGK